MSSRGASACPRCGFKTRLEYCGKCGKKLKKGPIKIPVGVKIEPVWNERWKALVRKYALERQHDLAFKAAIILLEKELKDGRQAQDIVDEDARRKETSK